MKILKIKERENPLFNRKEIEMSLEASIAPKTKEVEELMAKEFSTSSENVKIKKIKGRFGSNSFIITANIYNSKEDKEKIEPKQKKEKKQVESKPENGPIKQETKPEEKKE